jgi:hypothetical protein
MYFHREIVKVDVIYVQGFQVHQIFLAQAVIFPPGSLLPGPPGHLVVLINPRLLAIPGPRHAYTPLPHPLHPEFESVERSKVKSSKIPRPPNAFILYRKAHHEAVKAENPGIHNNQICKFLFLTLVTHINISVAVILGTQWHYECIEIRAQYKAAAAQLKQEHISRYPDYQYQPRKTSELKRRMTKKKAAALSQNEAPAQNIFGIGSSPSDHDFSAVPRKWSEDHSMVMPGYDTTALFDKVHLHNTQQELNRFLEESLPEVYSGDNQLINLFPPEECDIPWPLIEKNVSDVGLDATFDEFVQMCAGTSTFA